MEKKLNITLPSLVGYMEDAYPLSVLETQDRTYEWIYSNYVQLVFQDPEKTADQPVKFYKVSPCGKSWSPRIPWLDVYGFNKKIAESTNLNIVDFVCGAIDKDFYVKIYLDEYYLPHRMSHRRKFHYTHETLIYGYDDQNLEFHSLSYNIERLFTNIRISFNDVKSAYEGEGDTIQQSRVELWEWKDSYEYNFCIKRLLSQCKAYLTGNNSYCDLNDIYNQKNDNVYGLDIYEKLKYYSKDSENIIPFQIISKNKLYDRERIY